MELEVFRAQTLIREGYCPLARCNISIEFPKGLETVGNFYRKMADAILFWVENERGPRLKKEYSSLTDIWGKSRFLPDRLTLAGKACLLDENHFSVVCETAFSHAGQKEIRRSAQVWNLQEQTLLPMRQIIGKWAWEKQTFKGIVGADGCYPEGGKLVFFWNPTAKHKYEEKKIHFFANEKEKIAKKACKNK